MAFKIDGNKVLKIITYVSILKDNKIFLVQYQSPPNPDKRGWWIPAPEIDYGEDPMDRVDKVFRDLGLTNCTTSLVEVESMELPTGWHFILHFVAKTDTDVKPVRNVERYGWYSAADLPEAGEFAHGNWERKVALRHLGCDN